jgi:glycosyltransferase involved in cell wall biosynthesis
MKIGMVCRLPPEKDGIAVTYVNLVKELRKKISVVTIGTKKSDADYKINFLSPFLGSRLKEIVLKEKIGLLHIHYIAPFYGKYLLNTNLIAALSQDVPVVVTMHEVHPSGKGLRSFVLRKIQENIVKKADALIVHTPGQERFVNENYGTKKAECIYYGINSKEIAKKNHGKNILFFGILSRWKGVEYLIEAMKYLPDYALKIVVALPPPLKDDYKKELEKMAAGTQISFTAKEWVDEKEKEGLYKWADFVVMPYTWAPYQSGIVTDAAAYGIPLIVSKVGSVSEMTALFGCGEVIEPKNAKAIADAVKKVDSGYARYLKGIEKYRKEASWEVSAEKHIDVYRRLLCKRNE